MKLKKNRRYGFTLIELLAVIVILAIIALIATPIVLNIIEDSKDSSRKRSIDNYANAVEYSVANSQLTNTTGKIAGTFTTEDGKTLTGATTLTVDYDGDVVCDVVEVYNDGSIYLESCKVNGEKVEYVYGEKAAKTYYANGDPVFYNVDTGEVCDENDAVSTTGTKSGCMKFYAFNDEEGNETVNLILDHNTTASVAWNSSVSNMSGPSEVLTQLYNDTKNWVGTITPEDYTMDQSTQTSTANYTVTYSTPPTGETEAYKARLITAQEVAQITGADVTLSWNETLSASAYYYFHDLSQDRTTGRGDVCASQGCTYGWLYDRISTDCTTKGCLNNADSAMTGWGYWTVSFIAYDSRYAWYVTHHGSVNSDYAYLDDGVGVRPVITILKSNLS